MFYDTDKRHADLKIRLQHDALSQSEFFRAVVTGYLDKCDLIVEFINEYKSKNRKQSIKKKVKKLISLSSFQLKGDGWYSTDYARKPKITHTSTPSEGQDATKQSIESVTGQNAETTKKSVADSISKDVKKAKG